MAFNTVNIMVLFLFVITVGTVIASSVGSFIKNFENSLLQTAMESMNNNSLNNHRYRSGSLLNISNILMVDNHLVFKVSVLLESDYIEESLNKCDMLIKQDESNSLTVDDQSKKCHYKNKKLTFDHVNSRFKRQTNRVNSTDRSIKLFASKGAGDYEETCSINDDSPSVLCKLDVTTGINFTRHIYFHTDCGSGPVFSYWQ